MDLRVRGTWFREYRERGFWGTGYGHIVSHYIVRVGFGMAYHTGPVTGDLGEPLASVCQTDIIIAN